MFGNAIAVIAGGYGDADGLDTGVSRALLEQVSAGELPETFRIHVPGRVVAFGKQDTLSSGFNSAVEIAHSRGYDSVVRLPGGRAAVFHEETVAFSWTVPSLDPMRGIRERFGAASTLVTKALDRLGVPAAVGAVPGEYCPGEFSVHNVRRMKIAGIGQRLGRRAAHIGGVLVVGETGAIRDILVPTYRALDIDWNPSTVGSVRDVEPGIGTSAVIDAIVETLATANPIVEATIGADTLGRARELAPFHLP